MKYIPKCMLILLFIYLGNEGLPNVACPHPTHTHTHQGSHGTLMFHRRHFKIGLMCPLWEVSVLWETSSLPKGMHVLVGVSATRASGWNGLLAHAKSQVPAGPYCTSKLSCRLHIPHLHLTLNCDAISSRFYLLRGHPCSCQEQLP